jgi:hypothetical protein
VEFGGFEPGADELGVGGVKRAMDGDHGKAFIRASIETMN